MYPSNAPVRDGSCQELCPSGSSWHYHFICGRARICYPRTRPASICSHSRALSDAHCAGYLAVLSVQNTDLLQPQPHSLSVIQKQSHTIQTLDTAQWPTNSTCRNCQLSLITSSKTRTHGTRSHDQHLEACSQYSDKSAYLKDRNPLRQATFPMMWLPPRRTLL